ncbi:MAG: hypothetical protein J5I59_07095 [Saprospiraceae bacterium]|nr:hypothetical protein [Saprospiraceae bacterium]
MKISYFFVIFMFAGLVACKHDEKPQNVVTSTISEDSEKEMKLKNYIDSSFASPSEKEDSAYTNAQIYEDARRLSAEMKGDTSLPELLFRAGALVKGRKNPTKAIGIWGLITADFPDSRWAAEAAFQKAFTFDNDLHDKETAKNYYKEFLNKYPQHKMAKDAKILMANLDKTDAQLIEEFEKKNNIKN